MRKKIDRDAEDLVFTEPGEPVPPVSVVLPNGEVITWDEYRALTAADPLDKSQEQG